MDDRLIHFLGVYFERNNGAVLMTLLSAYTLHWIYAHFPGFRVSLQLSWVKVMPDFKQ